MIKKILKWTGITFLVLIVAAIAAPFLFKDKLVQLVKDQANQNLNAKVDFGDFDLTLFSSFPDFRFKIQNVSVANIGPFEGDTLASIKQLAFDLNIKSVISGGPYQINDVTIDAPKVNAIVLIDGKANWDITKPSTVTASPTEASEPTKFAMKLKSLVINDANISYDDRKGNMSALLKDLDYTLSGDFTQDNFILSNLLEIAETTVNDAGVTYLNKAKVRFKADLDMDMPKMKFTFKENELDLNDLALAFDGFVEMPKEDIGMDIKFAAKQTEFKSILSLVPSVYTKDFASVKTEGKLKLNGMAKGTMHSDTSNSAKSTYPSFEINLGIANAMFKYPSLPKAVNDINIDVHVKNEKNYLDATIIDVNKFHLNMAGNPIDMSAHVSTPISDPNINANVKGTVNLTSVKEFIPLEKGDDMSGIIKADISAAGRMSALDKKQYDQFKMAGTFEINDMNYKTTTLPYDVLLKMMKLNFTNQFVELTDFDANLGKSDIKAQGKIDNLMQYIFKDELITGHFNTQSNLLDLNQLMASTGGTSSAVNTATTSATPTSTAHTGAAEVPANIDFVLNADYKKVLYDNLTLENMVGTIEIKNHKVDMTNLKMNTLGGAVIMNGFYETTNPKKPTVNMNFKVDNFDVQKTFETFNTVQKLAPIAKHAAGMFTATLENFKVDLDKDMNPILSTINGNGVLKANSLTISGFEAFKKLAESLKITQLQNLTLDKVSADYEFKDGRVNLRQPVKTKINKIDAEITGSTGFDQTIDYNWKLDVPTEMFGAQANSMVAGLLGQASSAIGTTISMPKTMKVNVGFGGTVTKPTIKTGLKQGEAGATIKDQVVNTVKDKANEEAQKLLADAQAQVDKIKAETQATVDKLKADGYAQADGLVEQANNPIAKIAAKKAAELAKKEVDKKAQKVIDEADNRCNKILEDAKIKSNEKLSK